MITLMWQWIAAACGTIVGVGLLAQEWRHLPVPDPWSAVSGLSTFFPGCLPPQTGTDYINSAVEPSVAVDPTNPQHLIGVWQQDRWSNGAATGNLTAVSMNGGRTWTPSYARFSECVGGSSERASDPWITISPNGVAHQIALGVDITNFATKVLSSYSSDGGFSWSNPFTIDPTSGDDKETITADPLDPHYIYAVWDRGIGANDVGGWFARSTDGGFSWEAPRLMIDPGANFYASDHQVVVLPDGTLVDVFVTNGPSNTTSIATIRSTDRGLTWSTPVIVSSNLAIGVVDARTQAGVRTGNGIPSSAVDTLSGAIYITWEDSRFSGGQREGVALAKSVDGGRTWSQPVQVNQVPDVQAFNPVIAVGMQKLLLGSRSTVGIIYYDFRQATEDASALPTSLWQIVSEDGGNTWLETPVAGPFDMLRAPLSGDANFIGDYQGLAASGNHFVPFFVTTNTGNPAIPSMVFALWSGQTGSLASTGRVEINRKPHAFTPHVPRRSVKR